MRKIGLKALRNLIESIVREALDTPTISADLDPHEKELAKKFPSWASPSSRVDNLKQSSPAQTKAKQVAAILQAKGLTQDAGNKKKVTQGLLKFIEDMDPTDAFVAEPDEIASDFAKKVLGSRDS